MFLPFCGHRLMVPSYPSTHTNEGRGICFLFRLVALQFTLVCVYRGAIYRGSEAILGGTKRHETPNGPSLCGCLDPPRCTVELSDHVATVSFLLAYVTKLAEREGTRQGTLFLTQSLCSLLWISEQHMLYLAQNLLQ